MRFELKDLQRRTGIPILYVTHDQTEALAMSDRLAVMSPAASCRSVLRTEIYSHPADRFVADFIGLMNFVPGGSSAEAATSDGGDFWWLSAQFSDHRPKAESVSCGAPGRYCLSPGARCAVGLWRQLFRPSDRLQDQHRRHRAAGPNAEDNDLQ